MMDKKTGNILLIKNMVCPRCISSVKSILDRLGILYHNVSLGEVELVEKLSVSKAKQLNAELKKIGFELIETRVTKIVEDIKKLTLEYLADDSSDQKRKLSVFITNQLHYDYSYLSDLFSSVEGITIERYFIIQRIEKVKELIVYDELSLTEISYRLGFSSVHHLSAQFKRETGYNASHFKKIGAEKRKSIDHI
jgi:AraC family transcriptional regulator